MRTSCRASGAAAPFTIGKLATSNGFNVAFAVAGAVYLLGAIAWTWIPETRGRDLT
jgi:hypothetical protein